MGGTQYSSPDTEPDTAPKFAVFRRKQTIEARPYIEGELLSESLRASAPQPGDMIARDPINHPELFVVSKAEFDSTYEPITTSEPAASAEGSK